MVVQSKQRRTHLDLCVNFGGVCVEASPSVKLLGMSVDCHLTWSSHVFLVVRRCYAIMGGLAKLSHRLSPDVKKFLIEALVFPHIVYCLTVYGACCKTQRHRLQKVINHCARIVFCSKKYDHVTPLLKQLNWPTLDTMITERDVAMMSRIIHDPRASAALKERVVYRSDVSARDTRESVAGLLQLPRVRRELGRRSFSYRAVALWNRCPAAVRQALTARSCRQAVREWLCRMD